ncbi:MAG TPA: hypothetical protein VFX21_12560 [Acidimicrobiia bacterium]|nr:hypothetical protein [Acidimicrobiia bacterium]
MTAEEIPGSGCDEFDRARALLAEGREAEALDWFEVASTSAQQPEVRASACAFAAGILLAKAQPFEVPVWADVLRVAGGDGALADLLEAASYLQLGDVVAARGLLDTVGTPSDPWFPCSPTTVRVMRAHVHYLDGERDRARDEVLEIFADDPDSLELWDAFARLCAETDFDPTAIVAAIPDDRVLPVLAGLRSSEAAGVDRIADLIWQRDPGDARVLALVPSFASKLESLRCLEWAARMRAAGMGRSCPLVGRAEDIRVDARERVRAAALVHVSFGDRRGRESLELAVAALEDREIAPALHEVWTLASTLTDSVVVAAAVSSRRSLIVAAALYEGGASDEAYAVLVHGLAMQDAAELTTDDVIALLPVTALEGLAEQAELRGEEDVAGILEAVAVVAGSQG